ncbi:hypothetical protein [Helcococcus kunzii]|uniref:hypothetical protein n=1 Tax=Helcococcus kunzii TaxID=40091 RepID=UPI001BB019FD|nr:hypothetical protein [Helcococcus kunzii]QUY64012.1 hypothetical protein GUI37_00190 [Helcococcus kunzii]QZO76480.1 hypothetical protein HIF96_00190 [Helcococcus kunzii]
MYILELNQDGVGTEIGLFNSIKQGVKFISQLEGYRVEKKNGIIYEYIIPKQIPNYIELKYNNHIIPFTRYMFHTDSNIYLLWKEIPDLTKKGKGIVKGATLVDAYSIANLEVKDYINKREKNFIIVKQYLEEKNYEVCRAYFGSEDGEAILYKKTNTDDWRFLCHLDPHFANSNDVKSFIEQLC